ncbi:MAG TPA: hypothetical protein VHB99_18315, partial [Pirellulales bacterium]|nr:hypothetical protein [Pirellulales bacterium]
MHSASRSEYDPVRAASDHIQARFFDQKTDTARDRRRQSMTLNDTTNDAEDVLIDVFRRMPIEQKWRQLGDLYRTARILHEAGVRRRNPLATDRDVVENWLSLTL